MANLVSHKSPDARATFIGSVSVDALRVLHAVAIVHRALVDIIANLALSKKLKK